MQITMSKRPGDYGRELYELESVRSCCGDMARLLANGLLNFKHSGFLVYCGEGRKDSNVRIAYCPSCGTRVDFVIVETK